MRDATRPFLSTIRFSWEVTHGRYSRMKLTRITIIFVLITVGNTSELLMYVHQPRVRTAVITGVRVSNLPWGDVDLKKMFLYLF